MSSWIYLSASLMLGPQGCTSTPGFFMLPLEVRGQLCVAGCLLPHTHRYPGFGLTLQRSFYPLNCLANPSYYLFTYLFHLSFSPLPLLIPPGMCSKLNDNFNFIGTVYFCSWSFFFSDLTGFFPLLVPGLMWSQCFILLIVYFSSVISKSYIL